MSSLNAEAAAYADEILINNIHALRYNLLADVLDDCLGLPFYENESIDTSYAEGYDNLIPDKILEYTSKHIYYNNYMGDNPFNFGSDGGAGFGDATGFSGSVTNEKMKLVLSNVSSIKSSSYGSKGTTHGKTADGEWIIGINDYHGCCTSGPTTWYGRAGFHLTWWTSTSPATYQNTRPGLGAGFKAVWHGTLDAADALTPSSTPFGLRPGDIATLYTGKTSHQHGVMWTGKDWRSDCIQKKCSCYGSSNQGEWSAVIWRHPDCQEPGLSV